MVTRKLKRREFLHLSAAAALGAVATACAGPTPEVIEKEVTRAVEKQVTQVVEKQVTVEVPKERGEPPALAEKVAAGTLPPVADRLPVEPVVLGGREAIGTYGGEVRMIHFDPVWFVSQYGWFAERMLAYSDLDLRTIVPNVFESWEIEENGKSFTFYLRKGMKWSDGQPVTTEDVDFWWNDVAINEQLSSGVAWQYRHGGEPLKLAILDDYSFKITFAAPFGNFPAYLTRWHMGDWLVPKHYLKQFHAKYEDEAKLDSMATTLQLEGWEQLFLNKNGWGIAIWQGPDNVTEYPSLSAWVIVEKPEEGLFLWDRNPYYWKVDQAGNQLPYLDNIRIDYVASHEIVTMKIIQGELDYVGPHDVSIARYPLYKENEPGNNYIVSDYLSCMTDRYTLYPQHNLPEDAVLEKLVNHPNFVKALSVAIDRDEINQSLFFGMARMGQLGPMPSSKYYKEKYGTAWAQYDRDLANRLLDEMGLDKRDGDGFRLRPDGQRLKFNIEHSGPRVGVATHQFTEMVVTFWREVGIDATTKEIQSALYDQRIEGGLIHCGVWHADRCSDLLLPIEMRWYIPTEVGQAGPAQLWARWFRAADKEEEGLVEPPDEIKKLFDHYFVMNTTTDENERVAAGQKIFDYLAENPLSIGSVLESPAPLIFNKNMRNLPRPKVPIGWDSYGISTYHPEGFFYEGGKRA